jgi:hypothetical protein
MGLDKLCLMLMMMMMMMLEQPALIYTEISNK